MKGIIGIDEVGRGPLAGPVTICAIFISNESQLIKDIFGGKIKDSKKLKKEDREKIVKEISNNKKYKDKVFFVISSKSALYIDKHGISKAIKSAINSSLNKLYKNGIDIYKNKIQLDGSLYLDEKFKNQNTYIKGDERFVAIAVASIFAKVHRDNYMERLDKKFPKYGWANNVGYGTKKHISSIKEYGMTEYHRKSFTHI